MKLQTKTQQTNKTLISVHSVFPLVCVQVRQWGAWKLHPCNFDAQKFHVLSHNIPIQLNFGIDMQFSGHDASSNH